MYRNFAFNHKCTIIVHFWHKYIGILGSHFTVHDRIGKYLHVNMKGFCRAIHITFKCTCLYWCYNIPQPCNEMMTECMHMYIIIIQHGDVQL